MSELNPCPFCGGKAHLVVHEDDGGYRATVYCTSGAEAGCFAKMSHWALKKAWVIKSATEAWNCRKPEVCIGVDLAPGHDFTGYCHKPESTNGK